MFPAEINMWHVKEFDTWGMWLGCNSDYECKTPQAYLILAFVYNCKYFSLLQLPNKANVFLGHKGDDDSTFLHFE